MLVFDGRVALMRPEYLGLAPEKWKLLKAELLPHWPANAHDAVDGPTWTYSDQPVFDAFESKVHRAGLG